MPRLTERMLNTLAWLENHGEVSVDEVARRAHISVPAARRRLLRLEAMGFAKCSQQTVSGTPTHWSLVRANDRKEA